MANLTLITDLALTTAGGAYTNQTGANSLPSTILDKDDISSAVGMNDGSYTQHSITSEFIDGVKAHSSLPTKADLSYARGHSNSVRYGQIFPRTVYGN